MNDWAVTTTFEGDQLTPEAAQAITAALGQFDPMVGNVPHLRHFTVIVTGRGDTPDKCVTDVFSTVEMTVRQHSDAQVVAVEVTTEAELDRRANTSDLPDLISASEAGEKIGITKARVFQLLADDKAFPAPLYDLGHSKIKLWLASAVDAYASTREAKPGRRASASGRTAPTTKPRTLTKA